jgi:hypothetical protein
MPSESFEDVHEERVERAVEHEMVQKTRMIEKHLDGEEQEYSFLRRLASPTLGGCYIDDEEDMSVHYSEISPHGGTKEETFTYVKYEGERVFHASFFTMDDDPVEDRLDQPPEDRHGLRTYRPGKWEDRLDELYREALEEKECSDRSAIEEKYGTF